MSMITLWKAGAEKILGVLGLSVHFPNLHQYELAAVHKQEISTIILRCELRTQNGQVVAEGAGARHIKQDAWNLNKAIKMASKSAAIDATIRVAGLTGVFIKTHQHTVKNNLTGMTHCNDDNLTPKRDCYINTSHYIPKENPITAKQKHLIQRISGRNGLTIEGLEKEVQTLFKKVLKELNRVEASKFIQHLNGYKPAKINRR